MDGERKSCTERILSAIEYGKLPNNETERRLHELVEAEVDKTDAEADMKLIEACQSLMWQLHTHGEIPYDSHYNASKAKIDQRLRRNALIANITKSVGKMIVTAAAVVLVILGLRGDLHWSWLRHDDTADQQQHIIAGNEVGIELIQSAIAEFGEIGQVRVTSPEAIADYIRYIPVPATMGEAWSFTFADISVTPGFIRIDAQYEYAGQQSTMLYSTFLFTDASDAYFTFEQSAGGDYVLLDGHRVYVAENLHRVTMCWNDGLVFVRLSGTVQKQEGISLVLNLLKEWYK